MVITKVKRSMYHNIHQSEQELHIWNPCQIACPSIGFKGTGGNRARFCQNSKSSGGHISHTTGPNGLTFWIWCCGFPTNISVLPRFLLQGAAPCPLFVTPCPLFVTPCPFEKAEMTSCPFDYQKKKKKKNISHTWLLALFCPFCCPHTAWIVLCIFY